MSIFEDLVADLKKENLLDSGGSENSLNPTNLTIAKQSKIETTLNPVVRENSLSSDISTVQLPETKDLLPEKDLLNIFTVKIERPDSEKRNDQLNIPPSTQPLRKLRKVQIKNKKKGRFCKTCLIAVPYYRFRCQFCHERITGGFFYYSFLIFSVILLVAIFLIIVATKTYN